MTGFNDQFRVTNTHGHGRLSEISLQIDFESGFKLPCWNSRVSIDSGHREPFTFIVLIKFYRLSIAF